MSAMFLYIPDATTLTQETAYKHEINSICVKKVMSDCFYYLQKSSCIKAFFHLLFAEKLVSKHFSTLSLVKSKNTS